jgi:hypothetical protein
MVNSIVLFESLSKNFRIKSHGFFLEPILDEHQFPKIFLKNSHLKIFDKISFNMIKNALKMYKTHL